MASVHRPGRPRPLGPVQQMGNFGWFLALFFGFWMLYITAISNVNLVLRQSTDHA